MLDNVASAVRKSSSESVVISYIVRKAYKNASVADQLDSLATALKRDASMQGVPNVIVPTVSRFCIAIGPTEKKLEV